MLYEESKNNIFGGLVLGLVIDTKSDLLVEVGWQNRFLDHPMALMSMQRHLPAVSRECAQRERGFAYLPHHTKEVADVRARASTKQQRGKQNIFLRASRKFEKELQTAGKDVLTQFVRAESIGFFCVASF